MATPEIPAEVMAQTGDMDRVDAVRHAWREAWQTCTTVHDAAVETSVETQIDLYWTGVYNLLDDEKSPMWQAFARVVERLKPDIGPWDKREAVDAIVTEFKQVVEDA